MRKLWMCIGAAAVMAGTMAVSAQELTDTFTTSGGLTVSLPDGVEVSEDGANSLSVTVTDGAMGATTITIEGQPAGSPFDMSGGSPLTAQELVDSTISALSIMIDTGAVESQTAQLDNGTATYALYALLGDMMSAMGGTPVPGMSSTADSAVAAVLLDNGVLVGLTASSFSMTGGTIEDQRDLILSILGSASVEAGSDLEASVAAAASQRAADPLSYLEPGIAVFVRGIIVDFDPETYSFSDSTSETLADDLVTLQLTGSIDTIAMQLYAADELTSFDITVSMMAAMSGDDAFDEETSFETVTTENGDMRLYNSADHVAEATFISTVVGILPLSDAFTMTYQATGFGGDDADALVQSVVDLANATRIVDVAESQAIIDAAEAAAAENAPAGTPADTADTTPSNLNVEGVFEAECDSSLYALTVTPAVGDTVEYLCPADCGTSSDARVWGSDIYTSDSSVCLAAIHAGVLDAAGGSVAVSVLEGQDAYAGSEANGITTLDYSTWDLSYSVAAAGE